jgi:alcohol dehydrogenase YqhD (iron-dependent ADH family)
VKDFVFYNPTKVFFGRGVNSLVGDEVARDGHASVLLHYGGGSIKAAGVYEAVVKSLESSGVKFFECAGVKSNPVLSKALEAAEMVRRHGIGAIVAIGGGSAIDSAKCVAAASLDEGDVWDFFSRKRKISRSLPLYAVATLAATASEMNCTSVITNEAAGKKIGLTDNTLFPKSTFIDPSVQFSVPRRQVADGGIDAICHVLETYFDGETGVDIQMEYAEGLLRSLISLIPEALEHPADYETRAQLAWGAANALNGVTWAGHSVRGDFSSHAIGHALSAKYDAIHGETLSIVMPSWMKYTMDLNPAFARFARRVFGVGSSSDGEAAREGLERLRAFFSSLGAPLTLRAIGVPEADLPLLAESVVSGGPIGVLKKLGREDVLNIYRAAY